MCHSLAHLLRETGWLTPQANIYIETESTLKDLAPTLILENSTGKICWSSVLSIGCSGNLI